MRTVLYITYYWPPSGGAGVQRSLKNVKLLPAHGVRPIVLTVDPRWASYPVLDPSLEHDVPTDVRVIRTRSFEPLRWLAAILGARSVPHAGFADAERAGPLQKAMRWVRGNWMVPDARRGWVHHAYKAAARVIANEPIDAVVISSPPHSSQLIGLRLKERFPRLRWIADLRDPWTDIYYMDEFMRGPRAARLDARWESRTLHRADAVVVTGPATRSAFVARYGPDVGRRIHVITNGYDAGDIEGLVPAQRSGNAFRITYVGTMAASYAPGTFFNALAAARARLDVPLEVRFVGTVADEVRQAARAAGIDDRCTWAPVVPHGEALREMAAADLLVLVIPEAPGAERIVPGKLFEYMAVGRPVLGIGPVASDAAMILRECGAGRMFERSDVDGMAGHVRAVQRGEVPAPDRARAAHYDRRELAGAFARLISGEAG